MEKEKDKTKHSITEEDLVMLEKAASLKILTPFEESLINDRIGSFKQFGFKCVITESQRNIIKDLAERYNSAHLKTSGEGGNY